MRRLNSSVKRARHLRDSRLVGREPDRN